MWLKIKEVFFVDFVKVEISGHQISLPHLHYIPSYVSS